MICANCPQPITPRSKSGLCRSCCARKIALAMRGDPEIQRRRNDAVKRHLAIPENRQRRVKQLRERHANMSEAEREKRKAWGEHLHREYLSRPDVVAKRTSPETLARIGRANTDRKLAWCPPERRDEYRHLLMNRHFPAAEARRIIEAEIPGTVEHARRTIANHIDVARIREERRKREAY